MGHPARRRRDAFGIRSTQHRRHLCISLSTSRRPRQPTSCRPEIPTRLSCRCSAWPARSGHCWRNTRSTCATRMRTFCSPSRWRRSWATSSGTSPTPRRSLTSTWRRSPPTTWRRPAIDGHRLATRTGTTCSMTTSPPTSSCPAHSPRRSSTVLRGKLLTPHRKRRSAPDIDEVEDGGRAIVIDEAIVAYVWEYARRHRFLEGVTTVDYPVLKTIRQLTDGLEVAARTAHDWEEAILAGYRVFREVRARKGGVLAVDLQARSIDLVA